MHEMGTVPRVRLAGGLEVTRILNGMWQMSGAHGHVEPVKAVAEMTKYFDAGLTSFDMADIYGPAESIYGTYLLDEMFKYMSAGLTTFDMADHYGPAEDLYGMFLKRLTSDKGEQAKKQVQGLTKWVPRPGPMTRKIVEDNINTSLQRMGVSKLDCLQFHWWDYSDNRYLEALGHLSDLKQEGIIGELALTNFDTKRLQEITNKGIQISSNQVQYSLVDMRPAVKMAPFCEANDIKLLTYGTLGGALISDRYLGAKEPKNRTDLYTASLGKYKRMIDAWGGWALFQELLQVTHQIAQKHQVSIANVATKYILDQPAVGGVIIGCRLGMPNAEHIDDSLRAFSLELTEDDKQLLERVMSKANDLMRVIGDCGDEYR